MPIAVSSVTPKYVVGGIPGKFTVAGTASGCDQLQVESSCSAGGPYIVYAQSGGSWAWTVDIDNDNGCACGDDIVVTVTCLSGEGGSESWTYKIVCDDGCPAAVVDPAVVAGQCINGKRTVNLAAHVTTGSVGAFCEWDFGDGSAPQGFWAAGGSTKNDARSHDFAPGNYTVTLTVTLGDGTSCSPTSIQVAVAPCAQCPPGQYFDGAKGRCEACPTIGAPLVTVTGCAKGPAPGSAVASLSVQPPAGFSVVSCDWQITLPNGTDIAYINGAGASVATNTAGWFGPGSTGNLVNLSGAGNYSVAVHVKLGGAAAACELIASVAFSVPPCGCPPGAYMNSATGQCARCPQATPPMVKVAGCASGKPPGASAAFSTSPPAGFTAASYDWSITLPDGKTAIAAGAGPSISSTAGTWSGQGSSGGNVNLAQPGTYSVAVVVHLAGDAAGCTVLASSSFKVPACSCPHGQSGEWSVSGSTGSGSTFKTSSCDSATVQIDLAIDKGQFADSDIQYKWDFGDGTVGQPIMGPAGASQQHTFTNPSSGQSKTYTVVVTVSVPSSPDCAPFSEQVHITVPACKPDDSTTNGNTNGGFSLCCLLLLLWGVAWVTTGLLLYYAVWVGAGISAAVYAVLFAVWLFKCCRPCGTKGCRCLATSWHWVFTALLLLALSFLVSIVPGNALVFSAYGLAQAGLLLLLKIWHCGKLPNPLDPSTWPKCGCK